MKPHEIRDALSAVAVVAGVLPIVGVNLAYWLAQDAGHVPSCFVFLDGCTSVSATGRVPPGSLVFKATLLPTAVITAIYWYLASLWLQSLGDRSPTQRMLPWMGFLAALFLSLYTAVLGHVDASYDIARRIAVLAYLSLALMSQLLLTKRVEDRYRAGKLIPRWVLRAKVALLAVMIILGLTLIPASLWTADSKTIEYVLEWNFCVLLAAYYPLTACAWSATGFHLRLGTH